MLKFYERREQVVKPGLARLSAIGSAKLTPFLTNDTPLCITAARVARVYTARGACSDRFESFPSRSNDSRCHEFLRGHVSPLKRRERSSLHSALDYVSLLFSRIRPRSVHPRGGKILFVHKRHTLSSILELYFLRVFHAIIRFSMHFCERNS